MYVFPRSNFLYIIYITVFNFSIFVFNFATKFLGIVEHYKIRTVTVLANKPHDFLFCVWLS